MADVRIPFASTGRDIAVADYPLNRVRYIVKSVEFTPDPAVMKLRVERALREAGIEAEVIVAGNVVTVQVEGQIVIERM